MRKLWIIIAVMLLPALAACDKADPDNDNGHDCVDLGLSVKWATCNIGASKPSEYGKYFQWGEPAASEWGGTWRMPTKEECRELVDGCSWTWTEVDGVGGFKVESRKNGNSIFLPATGCSTNGKVYDAGQDGYYWSSSAYSTSHAWHIYYFKGGKTSVGMAPKTMGATVRAVCR